MRVQKAYILGACNRKKEAEQTRPCVKPATLQPLFLYTLERLYHPMYLPDEAI